MPTPPPFNVSGPPRPAGRGGIRALGIVLLVIGLAGHLYAAHAIGGSRIAYTHHVLGFVLILVVTGAIVIVMGRRFRRSRPDVTLLAVGAVQALLGILVALAPHSATR